MSTVQQLFDLTGKTAIVTGAGSGLGAAFAEALAEAGASVVCAGRRLERVEATAAALRERGLDASAIHADVVDEASVTAMVAHAVTLHGSVDILVNNAGTAAAGPPTELSLDDWTRVLDVNLTGVFLCCREAAKAMIAAGRPGSIVNVASILGAVASEPASAVAYSASKGGVVNLTRDLGVHWAPNGIRVNALGPAYFPSEMTEPFLQAPGMVEAISARTPMSRLGRLDELKGPIVFLASEASSYITGQTVYVDGGWTAW